jgi:uncharacterized protein
MHFAKRRLVSVTWVILFFTAFLACGQDKQAKHSLWKVQGKSNAVYLLGSIHVLKSDFYPLPQPIEDAYKRSGIVMFETDFAEMAASQGKLLKAGMLPPNETLSQHVSGETYALVQSYLRENVGSATMLDQFRPWMASVTLLTVELMKLGYDPQQGVDRYFFDKAQRDKKRLDSFESVDFQLGLFQGLTKAEQDQMLSESVREAKDIKGEISEMVNAWKTGDSKALDKLIVQEMRDYPDVHKKLLLDRNERWMAKLVEQLAGKEDVFVVVGAAHLVGASSVVDLLQKKGYRVVQL